MEPKEISGCEEPLWVKKAKIYNQSSPLMKMLYTMEVFEITKDGKRKLSLFMAILSMVVALFLMCGVLGIVICLLSLIANIVEYTAFTSMMFFGFCVCGLMFLLLSIAARMVWGEDAVSELRELVRTRGQYRRIESEDDPRYIAMKREHDDRESWAHARVKELTREWEEKNHA